LTFGFLKMKKEPTRCRKVEVFICTNNSTCFVHHYAHHQEHNTKQTGIALLMTGIMMPETCWVININKKNSTFLHLVGSFFTFMIQDGRSHEINIRVPVTTAWRVLRLGMEGTASRFGGWLRVHWISSHEPSRMGGPPTVMLGEVQIIRLHKNSHVTRQFTRPRIGTDSVVFLRIGTGGRLLWMR
jgi:hypothetical protein